MAWRVFVVTSGLAVLFFLVVGQRVPPSQELTSASYRPQLRHGSGIRSTERACASWAYEVIDGKVLSSELAEMSGLVVSQRYDNLFYHVNDSGHQPLILTTDTKGRILHRFRFASESRDVEDLSLGPCPWGGSCLYVADSGNNFHWHSQFEIHVIEESLLWDGRGQRSRYTVKIRDGRRYDIEAMAVEPQGGELLFFTKERGHSKVLSGRIGRGNTIDLTQIAVLPVNMVTGASFHPQGKRLLVLNAEGGHELRSDGPGGPWPAWPQWSSLQRIPLLSRAQQEAVSYSGVDFDFWYSSEKKAWSERPWGLVSVRCQQQPFAPEQGPGK